MFEQRVGRVAAVAEDVRGVAAAAEGQHVLRKRRPVSRTASSFSSPTSSKAAKASAESTSAHLYE